MPAPIPAPGVSEGVSNAAGRVRNFNARYLVGTPVRYWPGAREGDGRKSVTRTPAWLVGGHTPCVSVDGYPGGIALTHVKPTARRTACKHCGGPMPGPDVGNWGPYCSGFCEMQDEVRS